MKEVCIGLVGGGYAADLHCNGYRNVHGLSVRLKNVADIDEEKARTTAETYGFERATDSFEELLADSEIEVIDICTPPHLHLRMAEKALRAGKHVICEKPLTGILWLKQTEAHARGERIRVESVSAETGRTSAGLSVYEHRHIAARPHDVEDFAAVTLSFSDGTRALVIACDTALGGTRNYVELFCNDAALNCVLTPTNLLDTYFLDENGMDDVYISEMLPAKVGWNKAFVSDEIIRGYAGELQNFMDVVVHDAPLHSGFDLAALTVKVIYASYQSAEEGRRITLPEEEQI